MYVIRHRLLIKVRLGAYQLLMLKGDTYIIRAELLF
jgi:hypothetical protein